MKTNRIKEKDVCMIQNKEDNRLRSFYVVRGIRENTIFLDSIDRNEQITKKGESSQLEKICSIIRLPPPINQNISIDPDYIAILEDLNQHQDFINIALDQGLILKYTVKVPFHNRKLIKHQLKYEFHLSGITAINKKLHKNEIIQSITYSINHKGTYIHATIPFSNLDSAFSLEAKERGYLADTGRYIEEHPFDREKLEQTQLELAQKGIMIHSIDDIKNIKTGTSDTCILLNTRLNARIIPQNTDEPKRSDYFYFGSLLEATKYTDQLRKSLPRLDPNYF